MMGIFIIGLLAGAGINLKFTGTYFHTKNSPLAVIIPISKNKKLHLHHWFLSLIAITLMVFLIEYGIYSRDNALINLFMGFFIASGSQGIFLKNAFRFIDTGNSAKPL